jgi:hypothetical protein
MRIQHATLAAAVALSSVPSPMATILGALLFAGLGGWARMSGRRGRLAADAPPLNLLRSSHCEVAHP